MSATAPNPDLLSAFAALRGSDGAMTVMVVSKVLSGNTPLTVNLANFANAGMAQVWQLTAANAITHPANIALSASSLVTSVPVTLGTKSTLRWTDNASNENGFRIERALSGSSIFAQVGQVGANVVTYTDTASRGSFVYRVRAFNVVADSAYSNTVTIGLTK